MPPSQYAEHLGKVVSNLQTLETWLRLGLLRHSPRNPLHQAVDLKTLPVGSVLPITALTNYKTLKSLLKQFNELQLQLGRDLIEESEIVNLRDAFAHGRVIAEYESPFPVRLIKFSSEDKATGTVTLTFNEVLDEAWFIDKLQLTKGAIDVAIATAQA